MTVETEYVVRQLEAKASAALAVARELACSAHEACENNLPYSVKRIAVEISAWYIEAATYLEAASLFDLALASSLCYDAAQYRGYAQYWRDFYCTVEV